ncbi:MAG: FtsQ-type POTRA domain-containing protein [Pseudomonadota bacterium]
MTNPVSFWEQGRHRDVWLRRHQWIKRARIILLVMGIGGFVSGGGYIWHKGWVNTLGDIALLQLETGLQETGIYVKSIEIANLHNADDQVIRDQLGIGRYDNIFFVDLHAARRRIEAVGWVESASVYRIMPDTIRVEITERVPAALWYDGHAMQLIDANGIVIGEDTHQKFSALLVLTGENVLQRNQEIRHLLSEIPALQTRVFIAHLVDDRRWDLVLGNDLRIKLPQGVTKAQLEILVSRFDLYKVWDMPKTIVDYRIPSRLVLRHDDTDETFIKAISHKTKKS